MKLLALSLLLVVAINPARSVADNSARWANSLGGMLTQSCMYGYGVTGFESLYDSTKKDRLWDMTCSPMGQVHNIRCQWTHEYVNVYEGDLNFTCPRHYYLAGLYSDYDSVTSDRIWRIECCNTPDVLLTACIDTYWMNRASEGFEFMLPVRNNQPSKAFVGLYSQHRVYFSGDRRWKFHICDVRRVKRRQKIRV